MSKLWSKRSSIVKNLYKKYKVVTLKNKDSDAKLIYKSEPDSDSSELIYKIIENLDTDIKNVIYRFIKKHYYFYSNEVLDVLLKNSVCILFIHKNNEHNFKLAQLNDIIIGLAFFHKDYFYSNGENDTSQYTYTPYINVKLLCLCNSFYNHCNLKFMIKCIDEVYAKNNEMENNEMIKYQQKTLKSPMIIYKLRDPTSLSFFCKKSYYCRPINIDHTMTNNNHSFNFDMKINLPLIKKLYNTFSYPIHFVNDFHLDFFLDLKDKSHNEKISFVDTIFNLLNNYKSRTYTIYKSDTKQDIEEMLSNPNFYKFIIRDHNNVINNFICLYHYYDTKCKNAIVYSIFLENSSLCYLSYILEYISEYCYNNNICDMIIIDNFVDITGYKLYKLSKFKLDCYYYCQGFNKIKPCKNGL